MELTAKSPALVPSGSGEQDLAPPTSSDLYQEAGSKGGQQSFSRPSSNLLSNYTPEQLLIKIRSVFPFDFFTDELHVEHGKLTVVNREFFFSDDVHTILIKSIKDVCVETSAFFATFKVMPDGFPADRMVVPYLKKHEAIAAYKIIQCLMMDNCDMAVQLAQLYESDPKAIYRAKGVSNLRVSKYRQ